MMNSLMLAIAFAVLPLGPQSAVAAPAGGSNSAESSETERVRLTVDHARLLDHQSQLMAELTAGWVLEDVTKALRDTHRMDVVDDPTAPAIIVRLSWVDHPESVYGVEIAVQRPGQDAKTITQFERRFFPDDEVGKGVVGTLADAVEELRKPQEEPPQGETVEPDSPREQDDPGDAGNAGQPNNADDSRTKVPLATMGKAGIGLLAGGVAVASVGAGLLAQGRKLDEHPGQPSDLTGRDFRPPGIAVLVSGGALAVAGAVMLGLDRRKAAKQKGPLVRVLPAPSGMTIVGRF